MTTTSKPYGSKPPILLEFRSSEWFIGITVFFAAFNDGFGYGAVVPVLPFSLVERSGHKEKDVQFWLSSLLVAFGLALTVSAPITAWAGDRLGSRKIPLILGSLLAIIGTVIFCVAHAPVVLVWARIFQGFSNGAVYSAGLPLIADSVKPSEVGSWMGFVFSGMTGGFLLSPFLAGIVYDKAGYSTVFALVIAVLTADLLLRIAVIEKRTAAGWKGPSKPYNHSVDRSNYRPSILAAENGPSAVDHDDGDRGRPNTETDLERRSVEHSPVLQTSLWQSTSTDPDALPNSRIKYGHHSTAPWFKKHFPSTATIFGSRRLMTAVLGVFVYMTIVGSFDGALAQFVKRTFNFDSTRVGLMFLTITTPALFGTLYGALSDRYGPRNVALSGFATTALGLALSVLINHRSTAQIVGMGILLIVIGIGVNLILTPLSADMFYEADILVENNPGVFGEAGSYAQVYSLLCAALGLATAVGPAWTGFMYEETNWGITMLTLVAAILLGSIPVYLYTGGRQKQAIALP